MRSWSVLVVSLLLLAGPVAALLVPASDALAPSETSFAPGTRGMAVVPAPLVPDHAHPLLDHAPEQWIPLVRDMGLAGAVAAMRSSAEQDDAPETYLLGIGDADRDGRDDVLKIRHGERTSFEAVRGPFLEDVLYMLDAPDNGYGYVVGDVDEDGVLDLVMSEVIDEHGDERSYSATERVTVLSGRDARQVLTVDLTSTFSWHYEQSGVPLVNQERRDHSRAETAFLVDLRDRKAGADILHHVFESSSTYQQGVLQSSYHGRFSSSMGMERLDRDGTSLWHAPPGDDGFVFITHVEDLNGDRVEDVVLVLADALETQAEFGLLGGRFTMSDADLLRLRVLDGATGEQQYERDLERYVDLVGDLYGDGDVVVTGGQGAFTAFDAWTGEDVGRIETDALLLRGIGDADRDGDDDLLLVRGRDVQHITSVAAADEDLEVIWEAETSLGHFPGAADLTGDGVRDVLVAPRFFDGRAALDGRSGQELWRQRADEPTVASQQLVGDVDLDGGLDIVQLVFPNATNEDHSGLVGHARVLRGSDLELVYETVVHDPSWFDAGDVPRAHLLAANGGDLDGNGAEDLLAHLRGLHPSEHEEQDRPEARVSSALALESATGRTLARVDDLAYAEGVEKAHLLSLRGEVGPAGKDLQAALETGLMGPLALGALVVVGVVAVVALAARRREQDEA